MLTVVLMHQNIHLLHHDAKRLGPIGRTFTSKPGHGSGRSAGKDYCLRMRMLQSKSLFRVCLRYLKLEIVFAARGLGSLHKETPA
jgi:hypothetical protein